MIYYTKLENQDYGLLVFKVIGAQSRKEAEKITSDNWGEALMHGRTVKGPPVICPLFENLETSQHIQGP